MAFVFIEKLDIGNYVQFIAFLIVFVRFPVGISKTFLTTRALIVHVNSIDKRIIILRVPLSFTKLYVCENSIG